MQALQWYHVAFLGLSIVLEVLANIFLKYSNGFQNKIIGVVSIIFVLGAFTSLAQAIKGMDLSIAYAVWGGFGILLTMGIGCLFFKQYLKPSGWIGIAILILGMTLLKLS